MKVVIKSRQLIPSGGYKVRHDCPQSRHIARNYGVVSASLLMPVLAMLNQVNELVWYGGIQPLTLNDTNGSKTWC